MKKYMEIEDLENYRKELLEDLEMNKQFAEDDELEINCIEEIMNVLCNKTVTIPFTKKELRIFLTKTCLFQKLLKNAFFEENQKLKDENKSLKRELNAYKTNLINLINKYSKGRN